MIRICVLLFLAIITCTNGALVVHGPFNLTIALRPLDYGSNNITWRYTNVNLVPESSTNITGNIVMLKEVVERQEIVVVDWQERGAIAVIISSDAPGKGEHVINAKRSQVKIPVAEVKKDEFDYDLLESHGVYLISTEPDENEWVSTLTSPWIKVWQASITLLNLGALAYGIYALVEHFLASHFSPDVKTVLLCTLNVSIICRLIFHCVDPVSYLKIYPVYVLNISFSITAAFSVCASLLIALIWHSIFMNKTIAGKSNLRRFKYLFYVLIGIMVVLVILNGISGIVLSTKLDEEINITGYILVLYILGCLIYCLVISGFIIKRLCQTVDDTTKYGLIKKVSLRISILTGYMVFILAFFVVQVSGVTNEPIPYCVLWYIWFVSTTTMDIIQIWMSKYNPAGTTSTSKVSRRTGSFVSSKQTHQQTGSSTTL
mmetsp:Transcript_18593/g.20677  ORF Transcript_18593/g.20677 Transcript_18593/m.20677 type:complete len:431 (+) Transcript_18593:71-1363(+)